MPPHQDNEVAVLELRPPQPILHAALYQYDWAVRMVGYGTAYWHYDRLLCAVIALLVFIVFIDRRILPARTLLNEEEREQGRMC